MESYYAYSRVYNNKNGSFLEKSAKQIYNILNSFDIKTDKYYTQCGNEIKLNRKSYTGTYNWERLTDYLERLNKKFNYDRDTYSEIYQNMLKINKKLVEDLKNG